MREENQKVQNICCIRIDPINHMHHDSKQWLWEMLDGVLSMLV